MGAIHSGYWELADVIRARFVDADATLHELFARIVCNICVGNTDDHARNHAAFWDGAADAARPSAAERNALWGSQVLNPYVLYDWNA